LSYLLQTVGVNVQVSHRIIANFVAAIVIESNNALVSVCIPTFNGERYLHQALESVKHQTYKNIEVIVSDDKSVDKTLELCQAFKNEVDIPVHIYQHHPSGIGANWNNCIHNSNGKYIKFLFQDDMLEPDCIEKQVANIEKYQLKAICCKRSVINENSDLVSGGNWLSQFGDLQELIGLHFKSFFLFKKRDLRLVRNFTNNFFGEPDTFLYSKDLFGHVGTFNTNFIQILDLEFSYRILARFPIGIQADKLVRFRIHDDQASATNRAQELPEYLELSRFVERSFFFWLAHDLQKYLILKKFPQLKRLIHLKNRILNYSNWSR